MKGLYVLKDHPFERFLLHGAASLIALMVGRSISPAWWKEISGWMDRQSVIYGVVVDHNRAIPVSRRRHHIGFDCDGAVWLLTTA